MEFFEKSNGVSAIVRIGSGGWEEMAPLAFKNCLFPLVIFL